MVKRWTKYGCLILLMFVSIKCVAERDPTLPIEVSAELVYEYGSAEDAEKMAQDELHLTAIFVFQGEKVAVLNGTLLKQGEKIADWYVLDVKEDSVRVGRHKNEAVDLKLFTEEIKS